MSDDVVTTRLRELQADFETARQSPARSDDWVLAQYDDLRREALEDWAEAARQLPVDETELLVRIREAFPAADQLERKFGFDMRCFQISVPDVPQAELIDLGTRQELIQARRDAALAAQREIQESCRDFITDAVATLRSETATLVDEMLETINGSGYVHQKTLNRLINFIDRFQDLNFADDQEMAATLAKARQELLSKTAPEYRDNDSARQHLVQGLQNLRDQAHHLAEAPADDLLQQFGQMGQRRFMLSA